jgi:asparagine synthetase B (glutamine-hydrolysing)
MDFNISLALFFASRGRGYLADLSAVDESPGDKLPFFQQHFDDIVEPNRSSDKDLSSTALPVYDPTRYTGEPCVFPGRVLLSGLGADEVFGGYARYRTAFKRGSYPAVQQEMELDINRLWHRNMGRDDRITAHHSREMRYPYLDSHLS